MKKAFSGKECDLKKDFDIYMAVETLARLHLLTKNIENEEIRKYGNSSNSLVEQYGKHNVEMSRVRKYIRNKNRRTRFEYDILTGFDEYYGYATDAYLALKESKYSSLREKSLTDFSICHGTYNYHNVLMLESDVAVVNFNHANVNLQLEDVYFFLRKIMEKHDWNVKLGNQMINKYSGIKPISDDEWDVLKILLMYPEKYWKVLNQYNNARKSWIPDKNASKLLAVYGKQQLKMEFVKKIWT